MNEMNIESAQYVADIISGENSSIQATIDGITEMNIESAQYVADIISGENSSIQATIDGITMSVPLDESNRHYAEILRQVEAGTLTIADAD